MAKKQVHIISEQEVYKKFFFRVVEARLRHEKYSGKLSDEITRLSFVRGDSIAVLVHNQENDTLFFTEQFRYPTYRNDDRETDGWLLEIPAGVIDAGETPEAAVRREVEEEIGYALNAIEHISTFYLSPGGSSERILLYYANVSAKDQVGAGGGVVTEGEDIRTLEIKREVALQKIKTGDICDAKSIIGIQWLQLRHPTNP